MHRLRENIRLCPIVKTLKMLLFTSFCPTHACTTPMAMGKPTTTPIIFWSWAAERNSLIWLYWNPTHSVHLFILSDLNFKYCMLEPKKTRTIRLFLCRLRTVGIVRFPPHLHILCKPLSNTGKHDETWWPSSYYGRHSASPPALRRRNISQKAMQQRYVVKTR